MQDTTGERARHAAMHDFVLTHDERLRAVVGRLVGRWGGDVDDVCQVVYEKLWRTGTFSPERPQAFSYAVNVAINHLRDVARRASTAPPVDAFAEVPVEIPSPAPGPVELLLAVEECRRVHEAVACLPERQYTAWVLCRENGLTAAEAAGAMQMSRRAVEGLLRRASETLRRRLAPVVAGVVALVGGRAARRAHAALLPAPATVLAASLALLVVAAPAPRGGATGAAQDRTPPDRGTVRAVSVSAVETPPAVRRGPAVPPLTQPVGGGGDADADSLRTPAQIRKDSACVARACVNRRPRGRGGELWVDTGPASAVTGSKGHGVAAPDLRGACSSFARPTRAMDGSAGVGCTPY